MKSEIEVGKILGDGKHHRDAIHIAVAPVTAGEKMNPSDTVGLDLEGIAFKARSYDPVGIVDPFLKRQVEKGQQFYVFVFPYSITGMRHQWEHPVFDKLDEEELWAREFAEAIGKSYEALMEDARSFVEDGVYVYQGSDERYNGVARNDWRRFWDYFEKKTKTRPADHSWAPYSCSC